ncbi:hypothetical protein D3C84_965460 [compost metagenome]
MSEGAIATIVMFDSHEHFHPAIPSKALQAKKLLLGSESHDRGSTFSPDRIEMLLPDSSDVTSAYEMWNSHCGSLGAEFTAGWKASVGQNGL